MKLLITGALGHIGSRFIHSIKPGEFEVVIMLDNLSTQRYCALFKLPMGVKFKFMEVDICSDKLDQYFKGIDAVVHLAAMTDATSSIDKQKEIEEVNFVGTKKVAQACIRNRCKLFFPSSTSVYTSVSESIDEDSETNIKKAQTPYAASKIKAEKLLAKMSKENGLKYTICRFGTIFGTSKGMRFHTAVNKFCWQAVMGLPITVWKTALNQKRPYLDLSDAVSAIKFILKKNLFNGEVFNVVTVNCAVKDIIEKISKYVPDVSIKYIDSKAMNQLSYLVSIDKLKIQGFRIKGDLDKNIKDSVNLLKNAFKV
jgi:nucleoside-diphosphate-sugar epimerase